MIRRLLGRTHSQESEPTRESIIVCYYCYYGRCAECVITTPAGDTCACDRPGHELLAPHPEPDLREDLMSQLFASGTAVAVVGNMLLSVEYDPDERDEHLT